MLREKDSRVRPPEDVLATLGELDEKLAALGRGMAAARAVTADGHGGAGQPSVGTTQSQAQSAVAGFQSVVRSRSERRPRPEPTPGPPDPVTPAAAGSVPSGVPGSCDSAGSGATVEAAPVVAAPTRGAARAPVGREVQPPVSGVEAGELAAWSSRLRGAVAELISLAGELELAATRLAGVSAAGSRPLSTPDGGRPPTDPSGRGSGGSAAARP